MFHFRLINELHELPNHKLSSSEAGDDGKKCARTRKMCAICLRMRVESCEQIE